jgi:hypothetical protein
MTLPNLNQTEGVWLQRTSEQGYHYVQDVFSDDSPREQRHQDNCRMLIARGSLQPEFPDGLAPSERVWERTLRYMRVHN